VKAKLGYGFFCQAALNADPKAGPRYVFATKERALREIAKMDAECASKAKHFVKPAKQKGAADEHE